MYHNKLFSSFFCILVDTHHLNYLHFTKKTSVATSSWPSRLKCDRIYQSCQHTCRYRMDNYLFCVVLCFENFVRERHFCNNTRPEVYTIFYFRKGKRSPSSPCFTWPLTVEVCCPYSSHLY